MANVKFPITAPTYTTSERDALSSQCYNGSSWIDLH